MNLKFETERLILKPLEICDIDGFFEMNNDPNVNRFLRNPILTMADAEKYVAKVINEYKKNGIGRYAVFLKDTGRLIGFSGLKFRESEENNQSDFYDLGYRFSKDFWKNGYATEAALFWINYGFTTMKLDKIHACAENENTASNHLLQKLGFQLTNQYYANNLLHNWYQIKQDSKVLGV
ncbi:MAG TPA: GNAT family N-acetyltransferase [Aquaticitalea sp.]|nr:GNAT family N-acetyltransferase [Aquaticitalea sp.]HNU59594.1 GNAT family N-acetyltransferase [Aquaticitalea sp.]